MKFIRGKKYIRADGGIAVFIGETYKTSGNSGLNLLFEVQRTLDSWMVVSYYNDGICPCRPWDIVGEDNQ